MFEAGSDRLYLISERIEYKYARRGIQAHRTRLWLASWKGTQYDSALLDILLECWSNGVLEKRKPNTDLL